MDPALYHGHHTTYSKDLPYWFTLADRAQKPILELGCGTGRILSALRQDRFEIYGLDLDENMLKYLKSQDPDAPAFRSDMTHFHLGINFGLILLTCNTYSTLTAAQREQALKTISAHLIPGGIFAASLPSPNDLIAMGDSDEEGPEETFLHPVTGNPVQVSSSWQTDKNQVTIFWHYDHMRPDGQTTRTTHSTTHQLDPTERYVEELKAHGFELKTFGDFAQRRFTEDSSNLILEAKKI